MTVTSFRNMETQAKKNTTLFRYLPVCPVSELTPEIKYLGVTFDRDLHSENHALLTLVSAADHALFYGDSSTDSKQFDGLVALSRAGVISDAGDDFYSEHRKRPGNQLATSMFACPLGEGDLPPSRVSVSFKPGALVWEQLIPMTRIDLVSFYDGKPRGIDPNFVPGQEHVTRRAVMVVYGNLKVIEPDDVIICQDT